MKMVCGPIFALVVALPAFSQNVADLEPTSVTESRGERTLISKPGWLRGLHIIGEDLPLESRPRIEAFVPRNWRGSTICARLTTMIGDYDAGHEYKIPETWSEARANLVYEGTEPDLVAAITPEDGGIVVERGGCVGDAADQIQQFTANFWNDRTRLILNENGKAVLQLNMNVARVDELLASAALMPVGEELDVDCQVLDSPDAIAFNHRCAILFDPSILAGSRDWKIEFNYTRLYRGRESQPRSAEIFVGAGP